jgi:hypothetical protein
MKIISNFHEREYTYGFELTPKEREMFDYMSPEELDTSTFIRYKGQAYFLGHFQSTYGAPFTIHYAWSGYYADSAFSGVVIKLNYDNDTVVMGQYLT